MFGNLIDFKEAADLLHAMITPDNIKRLLWGLMIGAGIFFAAFAVIRYIVRMLHNPFEYPYFARALDVASCARSEMNAKLNDYLLNGGFVVIENHERTIDSWRTDAYKLLDCEKEMRRARQKQYKEAVDEATAYRILYRSPRGERMVGYSYKDLKAKYEALKRHSDILSVGTENFKD